MTQPAAEPVHLRAAGVSVVLAASGGRLPAVLHWGADLGELTAADLTELADAGVPATVPNDLDQVTRAGILAEHAAGWNGRPGLAGQRAGRAWSPLFTLVDLDAEHAPDGGGRVLATGRDSDAGLDVHLELELLPSGVLRQRATVAIPADADAEPFVVDGLGLTLPVPRSPPCCSTWQGAGDGSALRSGPRSSSASIRGRTAAAAPGRTPR